MKHRDWLRLKIEGEQICSRLRQQNYQCSTTFGKWDYGLNKSAKSLSTTSLSWNTCAVFGRDTDTI